MDIIYRNMFLQEVTFCQFITYLIVHRFDCLIYYICFFTRL